MVPSSDPNWNYNDPEHIWERDCFLICVKAELKAPQQKVTSYAQVSAITQEPNENPIAFLERLKAGPPTPQHPSPLRGTLGSSLRSPGEVEGNEGFPLQAEKDLVRPSSTRLDPLALQTQHVQS